jgi:glyoxylase-like metal-dependent hydrolase (beta-lactamase superfamily II)
MNLYALPAGPIPTNGYLLTAPDRGEGLLIDAPGEIWAQAEGILKKDRCRLVELWITHGHWDHILGGAEVVRETKAKVRAHEADRVLIENPSVMAAFAAGLAIAPMKIDFLVEAGQRLEILGTTAEVRHVPGHCPGNVLFYFESIGAAFVGDALFRSGMGRTDLPGGDAALLARSIRTQIYTLPDTTVIYSGHGQPTTVWEEKVGNPFVRG